MRSALLIVFVLIPMSAMAQVAIQLKLDDQSTTEDVPLAVGKDRCGGLDWRNLDFERHVRAL